VAVNSTPVQLRARRWGFSFRSARAKARWLVGKLVASLWRRTDSSIDKSLADRISESFLGFGDRWV
jgi:hypothetical protein